MIPKIIHLCWISGDPYPTLIQKCIDSWRKIVPDYQVVVWDYDKVMSIGYRWIRQAVAEKKYAFAADCVRFYALYHYGGIYLDSDVEVLKNFDDLLHLPYFMGKTEKLLEPAIIGAEPKLPWIEECLNYYKHRSFINIFGEYREAVLPYVMERQLIRSGFMLKDCISVEEIENVSKLVCFLPYRWFSPKDWATGELVFTSNTYTIHHFNAEWTKTKSYAENVGLITKILRAMKKLASHVKHNVLHL